MSEQTKEELQVSADTQTKQPGRRSRIKTWLLGRFAKALPFLVRWGVIVKPYGDRWFNSWLSNEKEDVRDFVADADWARLQQDPVRARSIVRIVGYIVAILLFWAAIMQIDEIARGEGKVIPSRQLQIIQSLDGGIVSEILVKEGDVVDEGQVLLKVDETRFVSSFRESRAMYLSLLAKVARLRALAEGTPFLPPAEVLLEAPEILEQEQKLYTSSIAGLQATLSIARDQLTQRNQELQEITFRRTQAATSYELVLKELTMTKPLVGSGAVSDVELLRLERDVARLRGERDGLGAQTGRLQAAITEAQSKIEEAELKIRNEAGMELAEAAAKLSSLSEGSVALSDKVKQAAIKSTVRGTVKRVLFNTVGGVIQPGKEVVELIPLEDTLLLEAKVQPRDIAFLRPGQKAMVRFTAYDFSVYGGLEGTLEHIAADTVTDEKGNAFYIVRVRTAKPDFGKNLPIIPGMVADVDILTGKKSILAYLLKPVLRAKAYAMSER